MRDLGEAVRVAGHLILVIVTLLVLAAAGRGVARRLRQPKVTGEITVGLLVGPTLLWLAGPASLPWLTPANVMSGLKLVAEAALVLFMVGITHGFRLGANPPDRWATSCVTVGAFVPPFVVGTLLGSWILLADHAAVRGHAPGPALVVFVAVALSITAVPVLARILVERELAEQPVGKLAMAAAIAQDIAGWVMLWVAVALTSGTIGGLIRSLSVLLFGAVLALLLRRVLATEAARDLVVRHARPAAVAIAVVAITVALAMERLGLPAIFGAVLVGLAIPAGRQASWRAAVSSVSRVGRALVPLFFVVTGMGVFTASFVAPPALLIVVVTGLGIVGKLVGGYLGARLGRQTGWDALRIGVLMSTRGLAELIVLQVGYSVGILTGPLMLAFLVMTLTTTALTGPLLQVVDRLEARRRPVRSRPSGLRPGT